MLESIPGTAGIMISPPGVPGSPGAQHHVRLAAQVVRQAPRLVNRKVREPAAGATGVERALGRRGFSCPPREGYAGTSAWSGRPCHSRSPPPRLPGQAQSRPLPSDCGSWPTSIRRASFPTRSSLPPRRSCSATYDFVSPVYCRERVIPATSDATPAVRPAMNSCPLGVRAAQASSCQVQLPLSQLTVAANP
jgi:hypothetical protein